jgi:hypothetical protein
MTRHKRTKTNIASRNRAVRSNATPLRLESLEDRCLPSTSPLSAYGQLPLAFEPNVGQVQGQANFLSHGPGYELLLRPGDATLALQKPSAAGTVATSQVLDLHWIGANPNGTATALDPLSGVSNYLIGNDPSQWHTNVPTYGQVEYQNLYPGINAIYYGNQGGQLEFDLVLQPGANPGTIQLQIKGAQSISLDGQRNLVLHTAAGDVIEKAPTVYQQINGARQALAGRYVIENNHTVGFAIAAYNADLPLTIDPTMTYSTFFGGGNFEEGEGIAADRSGNAYITAGTDSADFPTTPGAFQTTFAGNSDATIVKLNAAGTAVVYSTYIGGTDYDQVDGLAIGPDGSAYITGETTSTNFPTLNAYQPHNAGLYDIFLTRLNPAGNGLVYSTYFGTSGDEIAYGIAVDQYGNAFITGSGPTNFPVINSVALSSHTGASVAFIGKFNPYGSLLYSTWAGGSQGFSDGRGIAVDSAGNAYVTGDTGGTNFPIVGGEQPHLNGSANDAFVIKLNDAGNSILYSTYLGGTNQEQGSAIAVDANDNFYVTGFTYSSNFPLWNAVHAYSGGQDAFVTKFNASGSLAYSTYLGGSGSDQSNGIGVDSNGDAWVVGATQSTNFPTTANALQSTFGGNSDGFVSEFSPTGSQRYSSYLGGAVSDAANAVAVDSGGSVYVTGGTQSGNFPTAGAPVQAVNAQGGDIFITKLSPYNWTAADVSVGADNKARILWNTGNGSTTIWSVSGASSVTGSTLAGPLTGWYAKATEAGNDGLNRILWTNSNGSTALWLLPDSGPVEASATYGAIAGWSPQDVTVGPDGLTRILWTSKTGAMAVWKMNTNLSVASTVIYGPFSGWTAKRFADGADGLIRVLWTNINGSASLWVLNPDGTVNGSTTFPGSTGWEAQDVAVGSDNQARILWTNENGTETVWTVNSSFQASSGPLYGPIAGWTAVRLASGSDGLIRLLWDNLNGQASLWVLGSNDTLQSSGVFGPF